MKKIFVFVVLTLIFPIAVHADRIILNCPGEVKPGSDFSCEVTGESSKTIGSLRTVLNLSNGLSYVGFIPDSNWQGGLDNKSMKLSLYTASDTPANFSIGTLKLKAASAGNQTITLSDVFFYDDIDTVTVATLTKQISVAAPNSSSSSSSKSSSSSSSHSSNSSNSSNNNEKKDDNKTDDDKTNTDGNKTEVITSTYLVDIMIDGYNIDFDKNTFSYDLNIGDEKELIIEPMLEDNSSSYTIVGNRNLQDGSVISIVIVDQNGSNKKQYNINIHKEQKKSYLKYIFIGLIGVLLIINIFRILKGSNKKVDGE